MSPRLEQDPSVLAAFAWSESIIADVLHRYYPERMQGGAQKDQLFLLHLYFWKALIFGSEALSRKQRRALVEAACEAGLDMTYLSDIDDEVITELLEVVLQRFRTMQHEARQYHLLLMAVAARLRVTVLVDHLNSDRSRLFEVVARN